MTEDLKLKGMYGYCPTCGALGVQRERRQNGNDTCEQGHTYPSRSRLDVPNITVGTPDKSIVAPEFTMTTESFEPYTFSTEEDEDAFTAESDDEILKWVKR